MTLDFHSKLKLLSLELGTLEDYSPERTIPVLDRMIEHIEPNISPFDPHAYFVLLEKLKELKKAHSPSSTLEDITYKNDSGWVLPKD